MAGRRNAARRVFIVGIAVVAGGLGGGIGGAAAQAAERAVSMQSPAVCRSNSVTRELGRLATLALQDDAAVNEPAVQALRRYGPESIEFLMGRPELRKSPRWSAVLDAVAQQKDAEFSGLYWHTDLEEALAVAKREKKAVLSLRLLGKLTDELSCANSRFFRTTLYPNASVRSLLTSQFVLHWQSVRAVPIITIDFGDGRQIRRTITGNSLHLVLDDQGRTIDVLPGLYTAEAFGRELRHSRNAAERLAGLNGDKFRQLRAEFHADRLRDDTRTWAEHCLTAKLPASLAMGVDHQPEVWTKVAAGAAAQPILDAPAVEAVVKRGPPLAEVAGNRAFSKSIAEMPAMALIRNVSRIMNEDSVRNEYFLHARIHDWFATEPAVPERDALVARVYSELFLSPLDDPWYGLSRPDVYSAITNDGRIEAVTGKSGQRNAVAITPGSVARRDSRVQGRP